MILLPLQPFPHPTTSHHYTNTTMPAKFYATTASPSTSDLMHKLGFPGRPSSSYDRKQQIKTNMSNLQQWLDDDTMYETLASSVPLPPPEDTITGRPAVLIASTGSIRKKRRRLAAKAARPVSSNISTHSGETQSDSDSLRTNVDTLESFPMFIPSSPEEVEGEMEGGGIHVQHDEEAEVSKQAGLLGTFGRLWRTVCRN